MLMLGFSMLLILGTDRFLFIKLHLHHRNCDVQSLLCLPVTVCVWQGAWLLLSCSWADTPALNFRAITLSLRAWSAHHVGAGLFLPYALFMHPSPYRPADFYLPCSPCRFQPASAFPALRAVPPGTSRTSSAGRFTRYRPDLVFPPSRRHLPSRSAAVPPVPDSSAHPAASSRHLPSLLSLPLRRHLPSCSACRPTGTWPAHSAAPPVPTRSAFPAVPASTWLSCFPLPVPAVPTFSTQPAYPAFNKPYLNS